KLFKIFSSSAEPKITKILSGNVEHTVLQRACAIQLFSKKPLHALVLGSNLGNTLINTLQTIAPISTVYTQDDMGNLLVIRKHKQYDKGILAKTNDGLFIMLNFKLERPAERNPIVSAMEKGYVVVERNNFTGKFAANINVLAFAIPDGIRLLTKSIDILKRQIPFSRDILHKFHLVFVVQKPKQVSEALSLKSEDVLFLRSYIAYCRKFKVTFDKKYDGLVDQFMAFIKNDENHFVVDVREKIAAAVKRLACARAAMHMREDLSEEDVKEALKIVRDSLYVVK
ncbi:MAG: hypothetical protein KKG59_05250, partial [Nanoarchaeota archaeon]|nr:hypothetical protein [Nanoarchaeota archaeon]